MAAVFPEATRFADATRYLLGAWGTTKRRNIQRWVIAAKTLPPEILKWVSTRVSKAGLSHGMKCVYFFDNPFLGGCAASAHLTLPPEGMLAALRALSRDLDLHFRISAEQFQTEYCSPYALVAKFIARVARTEVAYTKNNPAWAKLCTALWEDPALRKEVLRVKRLDAPFESKDKGIPGCTSFMQSIEAQKIAEA